MQLLERRLADNILAAADVAGAVGARVDGNDVEAVHIAAGEAVARARDGAGPTLLECRTYRWRGHVGPSWDMDVGVKRKDELKDWLPRDPIARTRSRLLESGLSDERCREIEAAAVAEVEEAVGFARQSPYPDEREMTEHVWAQAREAPRP